MRPLFLLLPRISAALLARARLGRFRSGSALRLGDAGLLAAQPTQVIELGAAHLAAAHHLDGIDHRRVEREHAFNAFPVGNLADGEALVDPVARSEEHTSEL